MEDGTDLIFPKMLYKVLGKY